MVGVLPECLRNSGLSPVLLRGGEERTGQGVSRGNGVIASLIEVQCTRSGRSSPSWPGHCIKMPSPHQRLSPGAGRGPGRLKGGGRLNGCTNPPVLPPPTDPKGHPWGSRTLNLHIEHVSRCPMGAGRLFRATVGLVIAGLAGSARFPCRSPQLSASPGAARFAAVRQKHARWHGEC